MQRVKAISYSLLYGLLPYWCYEKTKHYSCSYWYHLYINMKYALRWITFTEDNSDITFEQEVNKNK